MSDPIILETLARDLQAELESWRKSNVDLGRANADMADEVRRCQAEVRQLRQVNRDLEANVTRLLHKQAEMEALDLSRLNQQLRGLDSDQWYQAHEGLCMDCGRDQPCNCMRDE